jgi:ABC-2 type transport system permease protein
LVGLAAFVSLGALVGGWLRAEAVLALANLLWVLFLGCGLLLPVAALPETLAAAVSLSPPGALGEGMRAATLGRPLQVAQSWGILALWAGLLAFLASRALRWSD